MPSPTSALKKMSSFLNRLEEVLLCSLLCLMVLLGFLQILFRNVISIGLVWIDPLLRHLVLWVALLGASVATRENRHITIDLLSGRFSSRIQHWIHGGVYLFSAGICLILIQPAIRFIQVDYQEGEFLALGIPMWAAQAIMPIMLGVIGLRFIIQAWRHFMTRRAS